MERNDLSNLKIRILVIFVRNVKLFHALHSFSMSDNCLTLDTANLSKLRWRGCVIVLIQNVYNYNVVIKIYEHKPCTYKITSLFDDDDDF